MCSSVCTDYPESPTASPIPHPHPHHSGLATTSDNLIEIWTSLGYDLLDAFYEPCGQLDQQEREYFRLIISAEFRGAFAKQYRIWLKAEGSNEAHIAEIEGIFRDILEGEEVAVHQMGNPDVAVHVLLAHDLDPIGYEQQAITLLDLAGNLQGMDGTRSSTATQGIGIELAAGQISASIASTKRDMDSVPEAPNLTAKKPKSKELQAALLYMSMNILCWNARGLGNPRAF